MKLLLSKKTKMRMKRAFFLIMAIQFFSSSIFPSLGVARISSPTIDDQIHISEGSRVEMEPLVATGTRSHEATNEEELEYDPQPKKIEEVQEWIDKYLESDNDPNEKPNWEKEVDEELVPEGWKVDFVEDGDEYFGKDYYTIFLDYDPQPEKIEEVRDWIKIYLGSDNDASEKPNWEEEVKESLIPNGWEIAFIEDGDEHFDGDYYTFDLDYDPQPETIEEVRDQVKDYVESDKDLSERPNWEEELEEDIIPSGWVVAFVEGGDEHFEADYYTVSVDYDSQPETIEEVREWIKKYLESDKDPSERPNWEKEVEEDLIPNGWEVEFVEEGDEYFEADYYTITLRYDSQPETIEEVREWIKKYLDSDKDPSERPNWEKEVKEDIMPNGWEVEFIEGGDEHFEADYYTISLNYDPQPETIEEVQEWIDRYEESDNDKSEKPNWEKEVDEELMPDGWYNDLVEGGDEYFEADYYTIFQEDEEREEVAEEQEEEVDEEEAEEEQEEETFEYDKQPETKEEVQEWVDKFVDANFNRSAKPHWEFDVDKGLMPNGWKTDFVESGDELFGLDFYTIFPSGTARAELPINATSGDLQAAINSAGQGDVITILGNMTFTEIVTVPAGKMITIQSTSGNQFTLTMNIAGQRHFEVKGNLTLQNIILDGGNTAGGVEVSGGGTLTMDDGAIIQNCYAATRGGGVYVMGQNSIFNLRGNAEVNGNKSKLAGGGVYIGELATFNLSEQAKVTGNETEFRGGGVAVLQGYFNMTGGEISSNKSEDKGGGVITAYSVINISGGSIIDNTTDIEGGGLFVGKMEGTDITVDHDKTPIELKENGNVTKTNIFNMSGDALIAGNESHQSGGGVFVEGEENGSSIIPSIFNMTGGTIEDNHAISDKTLDEAGAGEAGLAQLANGGGVAIVRANFNMSGGAKIDNNSATHIGGGVFAHDRSEVVMDDGAVISNNTTETWDGGILIHWNSTFEMNGGRIINNTSVFNGGGVGIISSEFEMTGGLIAGNKTSVTEEGGVSTGGGVMIGKSDIMDSKVYEITPSKFTMSGGTITGNYADDSGGGVSVEDGSTFTLKGDGVIGGPINDGDVERIQYDREKYVKEENGDITIVPVTVTIEAGNHTAAAGGGVNIQDGSTFNMEGGEILENASEYTGGGVYVIATRYRSLGEGTYYTEENTGRSTFNMSGGKIHNNRTLSDIPLDEQEAAETGVGNLANGGGVAVIRSDFTMSGNATIDNNSAQHIGGGVFADDRSIVTMKENATISNNTTETWDGGILIHWKSKFIMEGGRVINNTSIFNGGGVGIISSEFEMTGGLIAGNKTSVTEEGGVSTGGGVMIGKSDIMDSKVYEITPSKFTMSGGTITGNYADDSGGGVSVEDGSTFTLKGGGIIGGPINDEDVERIKYDRKKYEKDEQGNITIVPVTVTITEGNHTAAAGGGVNIQDGSTFNMEGGEILENASEYTGGGVYVIATRYRSLGDPQGTYYTEENTDRSTFNMSGGKIHKNKTLSDIPLDEQEAAETGVGNLANGGGVAVIRSDFTMSGNATIDNNSAQHIGGGVFADDRSIVKMYNDAVISNNRTETWDGGILIHWNSKFYMYGGRIINNTSVFNGGGVGIISSEFEMIDGLIAGNKTTATDEEGLATGGGVMIGKSDIMDSKVYTITPSKFIMRDGTITGNHATDAGGGVSIEDGSKFEMEGGTIGGDIPSDSGVTPIQFEDEDEEEGFILGDDGTPIKLTKGNMTGDRAGGVNVQDGSEFIMTGGAVKDNTTKDPTVVIDTSTGNHVYFSVGGGVMIDNKSKFTMGGGSGTPEISSNSSYHHGGGVHVQSESTFDLKAGKISGNTSHYSGGGVYVGYQNFVVDGDPMKMDGSVFTMSGGTIEGNKTEYLGKVSKRFLYGGGVHVDKATFNMDGGSIVNNLAAFCGGGVSIASGIFTMTDGNISGNITDSASIEAAGITGSSLYTYGGGVWVGRSYNRSAPDNVPFSTFTMEGGSIGAIGNGGLFEKGADNSKNGNYANESGGGVFLSRGVIFNMYGEAEITFNHTNNRGGGVYASWGSDWTSGTSADTGGLGSYKAERVPSIFLLNGEGEIAPDGTLKNVTSKDGEPKISNNEALNAGGGVYIAEQTKFHMWDGATITENSTEERGGGVGVLQSYFYMHGGEISNNSSKERGGGVTVAYGIFEMSGGEITDNNTENRAGGVYIGGAVSQGLIFDNKKTPEELTDLNVTSYFLMKDGKISRNTAKNTGGGVTISEASKFEMEGGTISSNETEDQGGGVNVQEGSKFTMIEGTISDNNSGNAGGGVLVTNKSTFVMGDEKNPKDATPIISNNATHNNMAFAGGVGIDEESKFEMYAGEIHNNTAAYGGGGITLGYGSRFLLVDGDIYENTATTYGGGVIIGDRSARDLTKKNPSSFQMDGGSINNNQASLEGGGVLISSSTFNMTAGEISGNTAAEAGGGVWIGAYLLETDSSISTFTMSGGVIGVSESDTPGADGRFANGNSTDKYGGGVNVQDGSTFVMNDGSIRGNYSGSDIFRTGGGGVFVGMPKISEANDASRPTLTGKFIMNGGEISKNSSNRAGGGVYIHRNAEFVLNKGEIVDNRADSNIVTNVNSKPDSSDGGGGVYVYKGKVTMYDGGVISRNETWSANDHGATGGGIALLDTSTFTMEGGIISDNWASHGGGGVLLNENNTFTMKGGEIVRNIAEGGNETFMSGGGGVYLFRRNWFNMYDGKINENIAGKNGGGVAVNYPQLNNSYDDPNYSVINMYGGEINNNHVEGRNQHAAQGYGGGGGVYIFQGATFNMIKRVGEDAPEIKNNTAGVGSGDKQSPYGTDGGGIYVSRGTLNVISGIITGNTAVGDGGGIFMRIPNANSTNTVKINDPATDLDYLRNQGIGSDIVPDFSSASSIANNTAGGDGGGIYVQTAPTLYKPEGYTQLKTGSTTVFNGNVASKLYNPPGDDPGFTPPDGSGPFKNADYNMIGFDGNYVSVRNLLNSIHPLNNYDINFRNPPAISIFTFFKVDAADETLKLPNAEFQLYRTVSVGDQYKDEYYGGVDHDGGVIWLRKIDGKWYEEGETDWILSSKSPNVLSDANGQVVFLDLPTGDYTLVEVKAPGGYQLPTGYWKFSWKVIEENGDTRGVIDGNIEAVDGAGGAPPAFKNVGTTDNPVYYLGNIQNYKLPLTGNGGYWLMALGLLLLAMGLGRILYKKYKEKQNSPSELEKNIE